MSKQPPPGRPGQPKRPGPGGKPAAPPPPKGLTTHQKDQLNSGFQDSGAMLRRSAMLGGTPVRATKDGLPAVGGPPPPPAIGATSTLTTPDPWKAITAPIQSQPGARSAELYTKVLDQFEVGTNPRYEPDGPERWRGHIFIWDVTRAMGCEIPHFVGAKELTLGQTYDWVRHEGPMRGWRKLADSELYTAVNGGLPVIALPREIRYRQLAFVPPQAQTGPKPFCTGAGLVRGASLQLFQILGVRVVDYFAHE